ncbi:Protein RBL-like protein [Aix galericulata]|nr:Protein RBL-like protein [Aix galericulata]
MAVVLLSMQTARCTLARSPPGTTPVGHQSTNWMLRLVLMVAMAALTSLGTTSPRYSRQHAMYLPCRGSHFTIWLAGSKHELVISATDSCSW